MISLRALLEEMVKVKASDLHVTRAKVACDHLNSFARLGIVNPEQLVR